MADTYKHGIYITEVATSLTPMVTSTAAVTVAIGVAAQGPTNVPVLCYSLAEFAQTFGYEPESDTLTLSEAAYVHFQLYKVAPLICVNVFNPTAHTSAASSNFTLSYARTIMTAAQAKTEEFVSITSVKANYSDNSKVDLLLEASGNTPADIAYNKSGGLVSTVAMTAAGLAKVNAPVTGDVTLTNFTITGQKPDVTKVTASAIIGGVDEVTGQTTGLACVEQVYPKFGIIPGQIIVPRWSTLSSVAAMMKAQCQDINGVFKAVAVADISTTEIPNYTGVNEIKNLDNYVDPHLITTWPKVALGGKQSFLSTHVAAIMCRTDALHNDIPYKSPSNESLQCDQSILENGTDMFLGRSQANYLNGIGIVTALNFVGGWKCWGNRTSAYPSNTDPKDSFIPVRRMMNWVANTLVTSFWSKIDEPINKRLVESVVDSAQIWLNGLVARGALVGGRIEFREDENPITDLADGIIRFHVYICPPTPAREIDFTMEMDVNYFSSLFE